MDSPTVEVVRATADALLLPVSTMAHVEGRDLH